MIADRQTHTHSHTQTHTPTQGTFTFLLTTKGTVLGLGLGIEGVVAVVNNQCIVLSTARCVCLGRQRRSTGVRQLDGGEHGDQRTHVPGRSVRAAPGRRRARPHLIARRHRARR